MVQLSSFIKLAALCSLYWCVCVCTHHTLLLVHGHKGNNEPNKQTNTVLLPH